MKRTPNFKYYLAASVSLITFAVYLSSLHNDFVMWDDRVYILENTHIRSLNASFFKWAFFNFYASNWHPLTWISHAIDYAIWGLNPLGHHLTNIVIHAANTFVAALLIMSLLDVLKERATKSGVAEFLNTHTILLTGAATGLLFGIHPLHVESVAWVAERKDLLCALFFLLSILTYMKYVRNENSQPVQQNVLSLSFNKHYLLSLGFFILALLSKPMAVTLPVVLLILDWYPFTRVRSFKTFRFALVEKLPFIAMSMLSSMLTVLAQHSGGAIVSTTSLPFSIRVLVAAKSVIMYLWKMIWPLDLIPFYPYLHASLSSFLTFEYLVPVALLVGTTIACSLVVKKQRFWLAMWGYYIVTLLPVLGIIQVGNQSMADRYTYLPSLGPFFLISLGVAWASAKTSAIKSRVIVLCIGATFVLLILVAVFSMTLTQIGIWKNSIIFWSYVIEKEPEKVPMAYLNRGAALEKAGNLDEAINNYDKAIALNPSYGKAFYNRGVVFSKMGQLDKAIEDLNKSIELSPSFEDAYNRRGLLYEQKGFRDKAISDYNKTISLAPLSPDAYFNLGALYGKVRLYEKSLNYLNKAISINSDNADYYSNRGAVYSLIGQRERALNDLNKAIELSPTIAAAYYNRGIIFNQTGKRDLAISDLRKACELGDNDGCNGLHLLTEGSNR